MTISSHSNHDDLGCLVRVSDIFFTQGIKSRRLRNFSFIYLFLLPLRSWRSIVQQTSSSSASFPYQSTLLPLPNAATGRILSFYTTSNMRIFTSQFLALTSICAIIAIVFPPPTDAAYIARHSSGNRFAAANQADKPHTVPSAGHAHGKTSARNVQTPSSRFFRFADSDPLVGVLDFSFSHHGDDGHSPFMLRDTFPRRLRNRSRRSSALVAGEGGSNYLVSTGASRRVSKRRVGLRNSPNRVPGTIDVVSGEQGQRLASLVLDSVTLNSTNTTATNSTGSHANNGSFPLNASSANGTRFYLVDINDDSSNTANAVKHVMVQTDISDPTSSSQIPYCATFDPNPPLAEQLMMEKCTDLTLQPVNAVEDPDYSYKPDGRAPIVDDTMFAADPHKSQIFEYDPSTGQIKPLWTSSNDNTPSHAMFVERDSTNFTTTGSSTTTPTESRRTSSTSASASQPTSSSAALKAQNVTLMFRPASLATSSTPPSGNGAGSSKDDVVVITTTITTTLVYTATATVSSSGSSSAAGSPMAAVAKPTLTSSSSSSTSSPSTSTASPSVHAAAAVVASSSWSSSSQPTSTRSGTQATSTSQSMRGSLEIEFVPVTASASTTFVASSSLSSSASSSSSSPSGSASASASSASTTVKPSQINADAVASEIANSRSSSSRAASSITASSTSTPSGSSSSSTVAPTTTGRR